MPVVTTDATTVRAALAAAIQSIVPRYLPRRDQRWRWLEDKEIAGTLRSFDVVMGPEYEVPSGAYGGGLEYASETEIRVSYPVGENDVNRFVGADAQDLAAILIRLHTSIPGMLPVSMRGEQPISTPVIAGESPAYVVTYTTELHFFVSDTVETE
jgi:hypothetical protein